MKRAILVILIVTLFLTGCQSNRFHSKTMEDYLEEYNISNVHFSEHSRLSVYGWEVYVETGNINNPYNQDTESMDWALGENSNGDLVLFIVPLNTKYDVVIQDSPFPNPDDVLLEIEELDESQTNISGLTFNLKDNKYNEFLSIYDLELTENDFFNNKSFTSSYLIELGTCNYNDETYTISIVSLNEKVVVIAHESIHDNNPIDVDIVELLIID